MSFSSFALKHKNHSNVTNQHMAGRKDSQSHRAGFKQDFTQTSEHKQTRDIALYKTHMRPVDRNCAYRPRMQNKSAKGNNASAAERGPTIVILGFFCFAPLSL